MKYTDFQEDIRRAVLDALDGYAGRKGFGHGWKDEDGFILDEDDPAVVQFLANEREKLAEFSVIANTRGIGEALVAVPEIR